jgi:hypothetical protein
LALLYSAPGFNALGQEQILLPNLFEKSVLVMDSTGFSQRQGNATKFPKTCGHILLVLASLFI